MGRVRGPAPQVAGGTEVRGVGIASAGPVDLASGTVAPVNIGEWRDGFPIVDAVGALFPSATVRLALDGAAAALAEHRQGAGRRRPRPARGVGVSRVWAAG